MAGGRAYRTKGETLCRSFVFIAIILSFAYFFQSHRSLFVGLATADSSSSSSGGGSINAGVTVPHVRGGNSASRPRHHEKQQQQHHQQHQHEQRIAVLVPLMSEAFPPYFIAFVHSLAGNADIADFIVFHTNHALPPSNLVIPSNLKLINVGESKDMVDLHMRIVSARNLSPQASADLHTHISRNLAKIPYTMVEYKPAYGHIFAEYIKEYSHWAYSDLDIIFGDLDGHLPSSELSGRCSTNIIFHQSQQTHTPRIPSEFSSNQSRFLPFLTHFSFAYFF
jgi:hypothetical protein